ncbi:pacearchaeosortase [Candidatus Pacearchaeota archaeon]|nr:pacearchaeosortase [Candidatus Pacearchaeota archaeon]
MDLNDIRDLVIRYDILLIISLTQHWLLYEIFTPLTLYPLFWIISIFTKAMILPLTSTIETSGLTFSLVPACVAGSAYYLLLILNLTTKMTFTQRLKSILFILTTFYVLNLIRLLVFVFLYSSTVPFTDSLHIITWYIVSILFVVGIWFYNVYLFKIGGLPIVDDFSDLWNAIKNRKQ